MNDKLASYEATKMLTSQVFKFKTLYLRLQRITVFGSYDEIY